MTHCTAIVFDLDGTLVDSLADIGESCNEMLRAHGFPTHGLDAYRYFVGNGSRKLIERALPADCALDADAALDEYKLIYARNLLTRTRPYDGVLDVLAELKRRGLKMAVCSNKHQSAVDAVVAALFPRDTFDVVLGNREGVAPKPDPAIVNAALAAMNAAPADTLYLGDSGVDMETSRRAGTIPVGALWGFRPKAELAEHGAKIFLQEIRGLLANVAPI